MLLVQGAQKAVKAAAQEAQLLAAFLAAPSVVLRGLLQPLAPPQLTALAWPLQLALHQERVLLAQLAGPLFLPMARHALARGVSLPAPR